MVEVKYKEVSEGIAVMKEVETTMNGVLSMFPRESYKYDLLIPVIALLIDGKYTAGNTVYTLTENDRIYLESFVFYRDENGNVKHDIVYPNFAKIGRSISATASPWISQNDDEMGYATHVGYIRSKRYITVHFRYHSDTVTVNLLMNEPNLNEFIDRVCNCIQIPQSDRAEFIQILSATRMVMNAA